MNSADQRMEGLRENAASLRIIMDARCSGKTEQTITGNIDMKILKMIENIEKLLSMSEQGRKSLLLESKLTPTEFHVAVLVREGKKYGEIARLLCVSESAVNFHRNNIRKKLGLIRKKVNLRTFLNETMSENIS